MSSEDTCYECHGSKMVDLMVPTEPGSVEMWTTRRAPCSVCNRAAIEGPEITDREGATWTEQDMLEELTVAGQECAALAVGIQALWAALRTTKEGSQ